MNLERAVESLKHKDEYQYILWLIGQELDSYIGAMEQARDPDTVMKISGRIACAKYLLDLLTPEA